MLAVGRDAVDDVALDRDLRDLTLFDLVKEIREDYLWFAGLLAC